MKPNNNTPSCLLGLQLNETGALRGRRLYDARSLHVSLRQLRMLHAVVDCNGFTGAANHLHLSQSAISYSIAKLQEQLGVCLLKVEGRKAYVTEEGRTLLERSRNLMHEALELEVLAEKLRDGLGSEVRLVVDGNFPNKLLMWALRQFDKEAGHTQVALKEAGPAEAENLLRDHGAHLAISSNVPRGFAADPLIFIEMIAVAHPMHPLFQLHRALTVQDLENQVEVVVSGSVTPPLASRRNSARRVPPWHVSGIDRAINALSEGFGYAWLPRHHLEPLLQKHSLRMLPLEGIAAQTSMLHLVYCNPIRLHAGARKLAEILQDISGESSHGQVGAASNGDQGTASLP
ncbi:LysR family transcriptional regulator [Noviherbaspirillum galbum]|uniref:LysR family transcriptional regulator n=1 Tax=Noviherbaspirillum galbum TaxID=2709383 RepID=A0A6B3SST3_9BURK|nr:LysR family transcriptional regulator [Noviherbaspirillum galbum]NEX64020.1 LysR family transcriptional regulator [Noviherbaspirillum galbum]